MIHLSVFKVKDIVFYLLKFTLVILIIATITRYFASFEGQAQKEVSNIKTSSFLSCFDIVLPKIKQENKEKSEKASLWEKILSSQILILNAKIPKHEENNIEENKEEITLAKTGVETVQIPNNVPNKSTNEYQGVLINNGTDYTLTEDILSPDIEVDDKNVIIYHTHTCESYTSSEKYPYEPTGNFRTTDNSYNVVKVGDELKLQLQNYGYNVCHDSTFHDYPAYTGSYQRSLTTVENILKSQKSDIIIDLHRDAIGDTTYAPKVKIGDETVAQLMFVIGTDGGNPEHKNWQQNLKFAIKLQKLANQMYPGLFKPIILRNSEYNQHIGKAACIIEVGATGNTLEEAVGSMKYLAKVISQVNK